MSDGDTTNLGPQMEMSSGPRFSIIDMGTLVGPERMDTRGMLKSEMRSLYENHSLVQGVHRAMADPSDAVIALLKPLMVLVAVVVGFIGAALIMESRASATPENSVEPITAAVVQPVPEPEPVIAAAAVEDDAEQEAVEEELAEEEAAPEEPEPAVAVADEQPVRKVRKPHKRSKKRKKHKKRRRRGKRRRR